jgi:hypothetical protein
LKNIKGTKWSYYPYLTKAEKVWFESLIETGDLTFFQTKFCKNCKNIVPKIKEFCSVACYQKSLGKNEEKR